MKTLRKILMCSIISFTSMCYASSNITNEFEETAVDAVSIYVDTDLKAISIELSKMCINIYADGQCEYVNTEKGLIEKVESLGEFPMEPIIEKISRYMVKNYENVKDEEILYRTRRDAFYFYKLLKDLNKTEKYIN